MMVKLSTNISFNTRLLDFSSFNDIESGEADATAIRLYYSDGRTVELLGSGFDGNDEGTQFKGTIERYRSYQDGDLVTSIDGLRIPLAAFVKVTESPSTADERKLFSNALAGADRIQGSNENDVLEGFAGHDTILGRRGNDVLLGGSGNDRLAGGIGSDRLSGGEGNDTFVFDTKIAVPGSIDKITDYSSKYDSFQLENSVFVGLKGKTIAPDQFKDVSKGDADANDRILYDRSQGNLFYDRDGSGEKYEIVKFAEVTDNTRLNALDFLII